MDQHGANLIEARPGDGAGGDEIDRTQSAGELGDGAGGSQVQLGENYYRTGATVPGNDQFAFHPRGGKPISRRRDQYHVDIAGEDLPAAVGIEATQFRPPGEHFVDGVTVDCRPIAYGGAGHGQRALAIRGCQSAPAPVDAHDTSGDETSVE